MRVLTNKAAASFGPAADRRVWVFFGLCVAACGVAVGELVDGIVATVGQEVILYSELMQEIGPSLKQMKESAGSEQEFNNQVQARLREVLNDAIENKILLREALLAGSEIKGDVVEERIADIKKRFSSNEEFLKELEKAGETMSDFRERVRKQMLAISLGMQKKRQFEKDVEITEAALRTYYDENTDKFTHPERVYVRRIFLAAGSDALEREKAQAKLEELKKQVEAGADFAGLAKAYSGAPDAAEGGLMGWVAKKDLAEGLGEAAFALPEGGVSNVLDMEFGCVLLKVEKKEAAGTLSLADARREIEPALRSKLGAEKYAKWMDELRKRSRVQVFL